MRSPRAIFTRRGVAAYKGTQEGRYAYMANETSGLAALRAEIDAADEAIHDAIMRRTETVARIGGDKRAQDAAVHRPAREAQIARRLLARHEGVFPPASLMRIWRELIAASVCQQGRFVVCVADDEAAGAAREHFGTATPQTRAHDPLKPVLDGEAEAALLPWPASLQAGNWWLRLVVARERGADAAVLWRLPFAGGAPRWLVVGRGLVGDSGDDRTLVAAAGGAAVKALQSAGISDTQRLARASAFDLIEIQGFVSADATAAAAGDDARLVWLGAYPAPVDL